MRIRIDGIDLVAREARLALQVAGFILVTSPKQEADYVVELAEDNEDAPVVISGADGSFERLAINCLAPKAASLVIRRAERPDDRVLTLRVPGTDAMRRAVSRALVEIFLLYVNQPSATTRTAPPAASSPIVQAQALTVPLAALPDPTIDLLTQRLIDVTRAYVETVQGSLARAEAVLEKVQRVADSVVDLPDLFIEQTRDLGLAIEQSEARILEACTPAPVVLTRPWWQFWGVHGE